MRETIDLLIQLQELGLIRDEQRSLHGPLADLASLNESIDKLTEKLDAPAKAIYTRLSKKDHIVMSPMHAGRCSMCGMSLAISQVQSVKQCRSLVACPSCARILYDPDGAKWVAERPKLSSGERKTGVARFSSASLMVPNLKAKTAREAIAELSAAMQSAGLVDDASKLVNDAINREATLSTAVGHGLAFPHVRGVEGGGLTLVLGTSKQGVKWTDTEDEPAQFVFFATIPTAVSAFYLKLISGLVETFTKDVHRKAVLAAEDPESLWKALVKATRYTIK